MKWSQTHHYTLKEAPQDAEIPSHKLMVRAGLIKKLAPGIFTYGNMALRAIRKFEKIVREELDSRGCTEILMPVVHPRELWEETNRWNEMGAGLLKFQNRNQQWFCLGATHEEAVTDYARHDIKSYRDLPKNLYQIQTKYRDEIRPRFGLMRGREFTMKDAYSFDVDRDSALKTYQSMYEAYQAIFTRVGLDFRIVQADAGNIGGSQTHEFQVLAEAGEDALLVSSGSDFAANIEVCPAIDANPTKSSNDPEKPLEKFPTPGQKTIAQLSQFTNTPEHLLVKTLFFSGNEGFDPKDKALKAFAVLLRGDDEVNPVKLKNVLGMANPPLMLTEQEVKDTSGAWPGSCGPVGLKIPVYADSGLTGFKNFIVGANEDGVHLKNVNFNRDFKTTKIADVRLAKAGDKDPKSNATLQAVRGIEVGHVFYLGTKYSEKMNAKFLSREGKPLPIEMGCYGIGITRTVQAAIEQSHDADGIVWPWSIAPYHVHVCVLDPKDPAVTKVVDELTQKLTGQGIECFIDDRDERPGVKFKDADLMGFPVRIVVGKRGLDQNEVEVVERKTKAVKKIAPDKVFSEVLALCESINKKAGTR